MREGSQKLILKLAGALDLVFCNPFFLEESLLFGVCQGECFAQLLQFITCCLAITARENPLGNAGYLTTEFSQRLEDTQAGVEYDAHGREQGDKDEDHLGHHLLLEPCES